MKVYSQRKGKPNASEATVKSSFPEMIFGGEHYRDDCNKVSFTLNSYQDHLDLIKEFPDLKPGTWLGAREIALFGDLGVKGVDKGHSIDVLLDYLHASLEDTFAFDDAQNDATMLQYCSKGIAIGNATDELKAIADEVAESVDNAGIAKVLYKYFPELFD